MITLYGKANCIYTTRVISVLDNLGLSYVKKNISDPSVKQELIERGGKCQVPYLIDGDIEMYESEDIIAYLGKKYASVSDPQEVQFCVPDSVEQ